MKIWMSAGGMPLARRMGRVAGISGVLLLVPLVAMLFTDEVVWDLTDFAAAAVLLMGTGFAYVLATRRPHGTAYRLAVGAVLGLALLLVWAELAVGIIGG